MHPALPLPLVPHTLALVVHALGDLQGVPVGQVEGRLGARFVAASGMSPSSHRAPVTRACKAHCKAPVLLVALVELTEFVLNLPIPGFLVCFSGFEKPHEGTYREM